MTKSTHAKAAAMIRSELKKAFPKTKFRVTSEGYAGGSSIGVTSVNGIADRAEYEAIKAVTDKYRYGDFDGMNDIYEYTNRRDDLPQVNFVFVYNGRQGFSGGFGKFGTDFEGKEVAA